MGHAKPGRTGDAVCILQGYVSTLRGRIQAKILYPVTGETWEKQGRKDLVERARERYFLLLERQPATTMPTNQLKEMETIVEKVDACIITT